MERKHPFSLYTHEGRKNEMNMVRHRHGDTQIVFCSVAVHATLDHDLAGPRRQFKPVSGDKCDEVTPVVGLVVRQIPSIKTHGFIMFQVDEIES